MSEDKMKRYLEGLEAALKDGFVKVIIEIDDGPNEAIWCKPVEDQKGLLRVDNIPFFTNVCCVDDIIEAEFEEGHRFKFLRTVERMTQGIYLQYEMDEMDLAEVRQRYRVFVHACNEHNLKVEAPIAGYAVVAVPYGEIDSSEGIILESADTAGLEVEFC